MLKKLVIYYSLEGSTAFLAKTIAEQLGADLLELHPKKPITSKGFTKFFWAGKQVLMKEKPELLPLEKNPTDYDIIVLGTPVWAGSYNPAFRTFFSDYPLKDKQIALFCSCAGNGQKALTALKQELEGNAFLGEIDVREALKNREESVQTMKEWIRKIFPHEDIVS